MISKTASFVETRLARAVLWCSERMLPALRVPAAPDEDSARLVLRQVRAENGFFVNFAAWTSVGALLLVLNLATEPGRPWSLIVISAWGLGVALQGYGSLRRRRRRLFARLRERALAARLPPDGSADAGRTVEDDGGSPEGDSGLPQLRQKVLRAAAAARDVLRASRPQVLPEITRGETRALALIEWLGEAGPAARRYRIDHGLRGETATRLAAARAPETRRALADLLTELDVHEQQWSEAQALISERRSRVESFLLALESTKAAAAAGADPGTVSASLRERIATLTSAEGTRPSADPAAPVAAPDPAVRYREEVRLAQDLQRSILPAAAPRVPGLQVAHLYRPSNEVGGDFYDFYDTGDDRLLVAIGDASGHGLDSSMVSSMAKSAVYMQLSGRRRGPAARLPAAMAEINRMMCDTLGRRRLMTLALLELDTASRTISWVNAGQVFPLLCRDGETRELELPGYPLGIRRKLDYPLRVEALEPGDRLLFLTDGYVEAQGPDGEPLGWDRLVEHAGRFCDADVETLLDELDRRLDDYLGSSSPQDDVTLIAIDFLP